MEGSNSLLIEWDDGIGWVNSRSPTGEKLLHQDWPSHQYLEELTEPLAIPRLEVPCSPHLPHSTTWDKTKSNGSSLGGISPVPSQGAISTKLNSAARWLFRTRK